LHVPILHEAIDTARCVIKPRQGKLIIVLAKKDVSKQWYAIRN